MLLGFMGVFALAGISLLLRANAGTPNLAIEAETPSISGNTSACTDSSASNGQYLYLGSTTCNAARLLVDMSYAGRMSLTATLLTQTNGSLGITATTVAATGKISASRLRTSALLMVIYTYWQNKKQILVAEPTRILEILRIIGRLV
jgi:hypothetical protein